jgi:stress-induced morphogen
VKTPLLRKLEKLLTHRFPAPATVRLDDLHGVIGVVTSPEFAGMETMDRVDLIGDLLQTHLSTKERRQVQIIVAVTPDEGTGYLAGADW